MSEQPTKSDTIEINPRTARAVAAILGQTSTDEGLGQLNQTDGRNQSEQASFLASQSPFLREIYERGGTVIGDVLTVPKENLSLAPEIEITTTRTAVEKLKRITNDAEKAKELAPQLIAHGDRIAGSHADGETRLKIFGWLYRVLEGKEELLINDSTQNLERDQKDSSERQFSEKWEQIVELSETLAALEPKSSLPENSLDEYTQNEREAHSISEQDEYIAEAYFQENTIEDENIERFDEIGTQTSLIGFDRIEIGGDLPKIPENLSHSDFEKLLEKAGEIDSQLEQGKSLHEILAPFQGYVELTRLDNELRLVEEEYAKVHLQNSDKETEGNYRFVATREELRELAEDKSLLTGLRARQTKITETIQTSYGENSPAEKVEKPISKGNSTGKDAQINPSKQPKTELSEGELELQKFLREEKNLNREIETLSESIQEREKNFRTFEELLSNEIPVSRREELTEKVLAMELSVGFVLKEKYPELSPLEKKNKLSEKNTFEIQNPAEYLFVRETAAKHFLALKEREIKNEYRKFESKKIEEFTDRSLIRKELNEHREKIKTLKTLEPVFAYKIEGSNRFIKGEPSERAVAGFNFVNEYIRYQLKQPETVLRRESTVYRGYAERLESAKTNGDVLREAYLIRQENHRAAGVWKNAGKEERDGLSRPLSKKEMTLLFLEQPARHYTVEMSYLKYNFVHYSAAKEKMTAALLEGKLEPSAEARKLIESLETRLVRRDLETRHKATKHFFESLKTSNHKLIIKNEFDHHAAYQKLAPHEKDWIYARANGQKENLEYKIAYARAQSAEKNIQPPSKTTNEAAKNLRQEFAAGTLWHQALLRANQKSVNDLPVIISTDEKMLKAVGFLLHNQTEEANLRIGEWLEKQYSEKLKSAGEILKTFARATREVEDNRMTVKVKITESEKVSAGDYKNLFAAYFPADYEKLTEFRASRNEKFNLEKSRRDAQTTVLNEWEKEIQNTIYLPDAPVKVFANEIRAFEEIEKIKSAQKECRRSLDIQSAILFKTEENLKKDLAKSDLTISPEEFKSVVKYALSPESRADLSVEQKAIFEQAQNKILISDFSRFTESAKQLEESLASINQSFASIATLRTENAKSEYAPQPIEKNESLQKQYESSQKRVEAEIITISSREKFLAKTMENGETSNTVVQTLTAGEREFALFESHRQTRIALEPNELTESGKSEGVETAALEFADALETVYQAHLNKATEFEIKETFIIAEHKRENLHSLLKQKEETTGLPERLPVTLKIYERELAKNEKAIAQAKISEMIETGKISLADLETKKTSEIFSPQERKEILLEAGERTRENLEPKELWANRQNFSENLQQAALRSSDTLEQAHEIYHDQNASRGEISRVFSALDADIIKLKNERKLEQNTRKFINLKTDFKRDLANMFENTERLENPNLLTAMTKGLLLNALENQDIQSEKLGLSSEKLSEISRTIALGFIDDKRGEKLITMGKSVGVSIQDKSSEQTNNISGKTILPVKTRQFEHIR